MIETLRALVPARAVERRYVTVSFVNALGDGLFTSGSVIYAIKVVGLTAGQIGLAMSLAGVAGLLAAGTTGRLADRFGPRRVLLVAHVVEGLAYLPFLVTHSMALFALLACLVNASSFARNAANAALVAAICPGDGRVRLRAQSRSVFNLGFSVGAGLSSLALAWDTPLAYAMLPIGEALSFFVALPLVRRLPEAPARAGAAPVRAFAALRNGPFLGTVLLNSVLSIHVSLVVVVVPLWIAERTSAPHALIGLLLVLNTVLCVLVQVRASKGAETLPGAVRKSRIAAGAIASGCVLIGLSAGLVPVAAVALVVAGFVLLTAGELWQSAGAWGMAYGLAPPAARGEFLGAGAMSVAGQAMIGPAVGAWAAVGHGLVGWAGIGAAVLVAALVLGPLARVTARVLARQYAPADAEPVPA